MTLDEFLQRTGNLLGVIGGIGVILIALVAWLGGIWKDFLTIRATSRNDMRLENHKQKLTEELESLKNTYTLELENLRNSFSERQKLVDRSLDVLSTSIPASHERILSSVDLLWKETLKVRRINSNAFFIYSILLRQEIESEKGSIAIDQILPNDLVEYVKELDLAHVEEARPYLGEKLWLLFWIYQAFSGRLMTKLLEGKRRGKYAYWDKDLSGEPENIFVQLNPIISDDEAREIMKLREHNIVSAIRDTLELKIIHEMNELISGRNLTNLSFDEQRRLAKIARDLEVSTEEISNTK